MTVNESPELWAAILGAALLESDAFCHLLYKHIACFAASWQMRLFQELYHNGVSFYLSPSEAVIG
jgi:hypothetical protein